MLYSNIYVDEPLEKIAKDWDYLNEKVIRQFFMFKDVGDNVVGVREIERESVAEFGQKARPVSLPGNRENYEIGPKGVSIVPRTPFTAHVTLAGTPHRTKHVFGYWHINDKDEIIMPLPPYRDQPARVLIIMGNPTGNETDRFAWYCSECLTLMFMRESIGLAQMYATEVAAVREYNSDPKNQICPSCGHKNLIGYSGAIAVDKPEERAVRAIW